MSNKKIHPHSAPLPTFTTEVVIQLINDVTHEVEHERLETNILTSIPYMYLNGDTGGFGAPRIWISDRNMSKTASFQKTSSSMVTALEYSTLTPTVFSAIVPKTVSTPYVVEFKAQFQPPTTTRTIYSLGFTGQIGAYSPASMVTLSTPCTQVGSVPGPGQTLVITYRIQILPAVSTTGSLPVGKSADRYYAESFASLNYTADGLTSIKGGATSLGYVDPVWNSNVPDDLGVHLLAAGRFHCINGPYSSGTSTINGSVTASRYSPNLSSYFRYGTTVHSTTTSNEFGVGAIYGAMMYGAASNAWNSVYGVTGLYTSPTVAQDWEPVQNIFNHSAGGTEPFQQVSALATGSGAVNATGVGTWTNPNWPEYYRISIANTGDVGTARYSLSQRSISGFTANSSGTVGTGSSWTSSPSPLSITPSCSVNTPQGGVHDATLTPTGSFHYKRVHPNRYEHVLGNVVKQDDTSIVTWDTTGVTRYNLKDNVYTPWDATTTPALPVMNIKSCACDTVGNVWVACSVTGLWKIDVASNTVSNITTFDTVTTASVHAVEVGLGNKIFVVVAGGIFSSADSGTTWVAESFSYVGISDGNWDRVYWIKIQRNSPSYRMAIMYSDNAGGTGTTVWWSTAATSAITGPTWSTADWYTSNVATLTQIHHTRLMNISDTGECWTITTAAGKYRLNWGTTQKQEIHTSQQYQYYHTAAFSDDCVYDYYGTPYTSGTQAGVGTGEAGGVPVVAPNNTRVGRWNRINNTSNQRPFINMGDGMQCVRNLSSYSMSFSIWSPCPNYAHHEGAITPRVARDLEHTFFEEISWNNYQWTGSAWVNGYHAPALDSGSAIGGPFDGTRHRFDVESHSFTGRSCIVVPIAAISSFFTTQLTFAARITPLAQLPTQGQRQQLLSWVDTSTDHSVRFYINDRTGNVTLRAGSNRSYLSTSGSNLAVGLGSKTFSVAAGLSYTIGMRLRMDAQISDGHWMEGTVTSYSGNSLVVNVDAVSSSTSSYSRWLIDYAGIRFGTTPTYGIACNVVLVLDGTSASCFVNGIQLGATQTIPIAASFSSADADLVLGGNRVNAVDGKGFDAALDFYRGTMLNVLLDSIAWTPSEISSHQSAPTTFSTATSRVRYELSNSLVGLETKLTHTDSQDTIRGVNVRFTDGVGDSFVSKEYYTFGVVKGILKDNATSFTHTFDTYFLPVEHGFSDLDLTAIPAAPTLVTEKVCFRWPSTSSNYYAQPGYSLIGGPAGLNFGFQTIEGDFIYTGTISNDRVSADTDSHYFAFGVHNNTTSATYPKWSMIIKGGVSKSIDIAYSGSIILPNISTWNKGDTLTISRMGDVLTFKQNAITIFTTSGAQNYNSAVYPSYVRSTAVYHMSVDNHILTYNRPANVIGIGNPTTLTGKYDPSFHNIGAYGASRGTVTVNIAGYANPASITVAEMNEYMSTFTAAPPGLNTVVLVPETGYLFFSSGDVGKTVTVDCTIVKYNYN